MSQLITLDDTLFNVARARGIAQAIQALATVIEVRPETLVLVDGLRAQEHINKIAADLEVAPTLTIDSDDMLEEAQGIAARLASVAGDNGALDRERKALGAPFYDLWKKINDGYTQPREYIAAALVGVNKKILAYTTQQREEAERKAREERQAAEAKAAEARRLEAEATAQAAELLVKASTAAPEQAQALVQQASEAVDAARARTEQATVAAVTRTSYVAPTKARGQRDNWKARLKDPAAENKVKAVLHIAAMLTTGDLSLLHLVEFSETQMNALAKIHKEHFNFPGFESFNDVSISTRKATL